jgi:hypothetical protein
MKKLLGYKWKSQQTRKDNVDLVLDIIGLGPNQDRMYCSLATEIKDIRVVFLPNTNPSMQQPRTFTCLSKSIYKTVNIT